MNGDKCGGGNINIGFIGAGAVGCSMGKYLCENSSIAKIKGYYSRTSKSVDIAATFTNSKAYASLEELVNECDVICITTPDDIILKVWEQIKNYNLQQKIICHFSGSLSSDIFSGIEETKAEKISIHPMYAFSDKFTSYRQLNTARLTMEGSSKAVKVMQELFGDELHHKIFMLKASDKVKYHAAAAFASNYVVGIFDVALELLKDCGFTDEDAFSLLGPLTMGNVKSLIENGTLDMGLLIEPVDISKYEFVRIPIKEEFGLFVRKDSPLTNKEYIIPEDLLNLLIISPKRNLVQNEISSWFGDYAEEINIISTYY